MIFMAGGNAYSLVHEYKNGWNPEAFRERYSEVLDRFDYVVGDWGYNQLRLRGFYRDGHPRAGKEFAISNFVDYINEYCNFGCAHFVLAKLDVNALPPDAVIVKEEAAPEAAVALDETGGQAAETAAALSGPITRWPLKERAGGPVRVPNVTVSAVARAAADAERREAERRNGNQQDKGFGGSSFSGRGGHARNGQESGGSQRQGRSHGSSGNDRRAQQGQGNGGQAPNKPRGGHRPNHSDAQAPREGGARKDNPRHEGSRGDGPRKEGQRHDNSRNENARNEGARSEGTRGGEGAPNEGRWQNRNRRRKSFGGKPGNRPDGGSRPDSGASKSSE
ncbi:YutD-like domain-containing protein [Cohnella cellulosilytica]|uniref:YutD-like domain-containing protein n=1 Tax=Cohnella cellulosilytica TaxID=986710 RepID=A0ABW2FND7_9BACL